MNIHNEKEQMKQFCLFLICIAIVSSASPPTRHLRRLTPYVFTHLFGQLDDAANEEPSLNIILANVPTHQSQDSREIGAAISKFLKAETNDIYTFLPPLPIFQTISSAIESEDIVFTQILQDIRLLPVKETEKDSIQIATRIATLYNQIHQIWAENEYGEITFLLLCDNSLHHVWERMLGATTSSDDEARSSEDLVNIKLYKRHRKGSWE